MRDRRDHVAIDSHDADALKGLCPPDRLAQAQVLDAVPAKPSCDEAFELPEAVAR